jgi:hypothetical protein
MKLSRFEESQAAIISRATIPMGALDGLTDRMDFGSEIGRQVAMIPWWSAILVRLALWVVWFAPIWRMGRFRLFGSLPEAQQAQCLELLSHSRVYWIRQVVTLMKMTICMVAFGDPKVLGWLGAYDLAGGPVALRRSGS